MRPQRPTRDEIIAQIAERQRGVASYAQLRAAGLSHEAIQRAVQAGRLRPLFRGVFAVGHRALSREGWWTAALLACGEQSVLSHETAAQLWGLRSGPVLPIHVIGGDKGRKERRLLVHRATLRGDELLRIDGLRVTTPARTIVDEAATLKGRALRELVERAQDKGRFQPNEIDAVAQNRRGTKELRQLTTLLTSEGARSHLERLFLAVVRQARVTRPEVNAMIAGRRRDFVWPNERLVVETDGYAYHHTRQQLTRDKRRDRELVALGWRPVRFTYEEIVFEPEATAAELRTLLPPRPATPPAAPERRALASPAR